MSQPLVLITNRFDNDLRVKLPQIGGGEFVYQSDIFADSEKLKQAIAIIIRSGTSVDKDFLNKTENLKFLVTATAGFDHIDLEACKAKQVRVFHTPEAQSVAAAELTVFMIFACQRKFTQANRQVHIGDWQRSLLLGKQIAGQSLGIIGYGRVGQEVAKRGKALGLKVRGYDPYLEENPSDMEMLGFEELMRTSDIVCLHVPKTKTTRHMIKKETLSWMNTEACLINMSRGDVINEADLIEHLHENPDFTVGLDVFAKEPLVTKSALLQLQNVVLTPHIGASTSEALRDSSQMALDKVLMLLKGEAPEGELPPKVLWWGS